MTIDIDAIEARANSAHPAPWGWAVSENRAWCLLLSDPGTHEEARMGRLDDDDTSEFIVHAREDVPALIAEVRRLSRFRDAIVGLIDVANTGLSDRMHGPIVFGHFFDDVVRASRETE